MEILVLVVIWIPLAFAVGTIAEERGRSLWWWFVIALIASPILSYLYLVATPAPVEVARQRRIVQVLEFIAKRDDPRP